MRSNEDLIATIVVSVVIRYHESCSECLRKSSFFVCSWQMSRADSRQEINSIKPFFSFSAAGLSSAVPLQLFCRFLTPFLLLWIGPVLDFYIFYAILQHFFSVFLTLLFIKISALIRWSVAMGHIHMITIQVFGQNLSACMSENLRCVPRGQRVKTWGKALLQELLPPILFVYRKFRASILEWSEKVVVFTNCSTEFVRHS